MDASHIRSAAVAGRFYPEDAGELGEMVEAYLSEVDSRPRRVRAVVVPHAGLIYSGRCAARVFGQVEFPPVIVILAPNHGGVAVSGGGASLWSHGKFETPLGALPIATDFAAALEERCALAAHDPRAHLGEHAIEVELPFIARLAPQSSIVPVLLAFDDWARCRQLAGALAQLVDQWTEEVLLIASSDMTHFESARSAETKDRIALEAVEGLDGETLLETCRRQRITMCGRAATAVVMEAARQLGATRAEVVDYRNSGWVTGDDASVVAYAGVVIPLETS
jgi:AmmeMemoRadiSam system protein B